ncbi:cupredoxin domain-containing protein [Benzoatithermus flavus]|uniref:Cupredoxin family copper-binding protein n=1 Tax=Benzoatithermus flavus TaxID=3108223 RepID=A0ABU8XZJ8_9PROT
MPVRPWLLVLGLAVATPAEAATTVRIDNFAFAPAALTLPVGSAVTWVNGDDIPHTVTSADHAFGSAVLDKDGQFTMHFAQAGTYRYYCRLHPHMTGTIRIVPGRG